MVYMMNETKENQMSYNGWSNYETWSVNVWYDPRSRSDVAAIREMIEQEYDNMRPGFLKEQINISAINWDELMDHFDPEDDSEYDDDMDGDAESALASAGYGTDESYGYDGDE